MKVLSLFQPWSTLVAIGEKEIETRSWSTKYRGPLAIHASKSCKFVTMGSKYYLLDKEPFCSSFMSFIYPKSWNDCSFPCGYIIATCTLSDVFEITESFKVNLGLLEPKEFCFGDYMPGRFAWILEDVKILDEPIPTKGSLGLWNFDEFDEWSTKHPLELK